jgi:hypothetical protein
MKNLRFGLLILAIGACLGTHCRAEECSGRSTADQTACEIRNAETALARTRASLRGAIEADEAFRKIEGVNVEFASSIEETQRDWKRWMEGVCRLEGDLTMGSAGGVAEAMCVQRLAGERAHALDQITDQLNGLARPARAK